MKYYRCNPDSEANQEAARQNEREVFALKMSHLEKTEHHMKTTKHTPGNWTFRPTTNPKNGSGWRDILAPSEFGPMYIGEAMERDAALISSAPDLLEALEKLHSMSGENGVPLSLSALAQFQNEVFQITAKAIAKARGEKLP